MKEKLTIEHLSGYLPYGLKGKIKSFESEIDADIVTEVSFEHGLVSLMNTGTFEISVFKPILRPLSDLESVINDNLSINEHTINKLIQDKHFEECGVFSHYKKMLDIELDADPSLQYDKNKSISLYVVLDIYKELLKGHYDIFGLIDKGLAIDINTI